MKQAVLQRLAARFFGLLAVLCSALMMAGCSDDKPAPAAVADTGLSDGGEDIGAAADVHSDQQATDTTAADSGTRNPLCTSFDDGVYGKKEPWVGYENAGKAYTCNVCRGGRQDMQGAWRLVDFDTEDPRTPLKSKDGSAYAETLTIDGNTWTSTLVGVDLGKPVTATLSGWYFCSDLAELAGEPSVFAQVKVSPEGAFGNASNSVWAATILHKGTARMALHDVRFGDITKPGTDDITYCRIGAQVEVGKEQVLCNDPL